MSVENAEAGFLAGMEHVFQGGCDAESGRFVDDEKRRLPGEGFVEGLYAQTESAFCQDAQIDSACNQEDTAPVEIFFHVTIVDIGKMQVGASYEFEQSRENYDHYGEACENHKERHQPNGVGSHFFEGNGLDLVMWNPPEVKRVVPFEEFLLGPIQGAIADSEKERVGLL
jgi:hypothetical protein